MAGRQQGRRWQVVAGRQAVGQAAQGNPGEKLLPQQAGMGVQACHQSSSTTTTHAYHAAIEIRSRLFTIIQECKSESERGIINFHHHHHHATSPLSLSRTHATPVTTVTACHHHTHTPQVTTVKCHQPIVTVGIQGSIQEGRKKKKGRARQGIRRQGRQKRRRREGRRKKRKCEREEGGRQVVRWWWWQVAGKAEQRETGRARQAGSREAGRQAGREQRQGKGGSVWQEAQAEQRRKRRQAWQ